jgi:hypothetical protein
VRAFSSCSRPLRGTAVRQDRRSGRREQHERRAREPDQLVLEDRDRARGPGRQRDQVANDGQKSCEKHADGRVVLDAGAPPAATSSQVGGSPGRISGSAGVRSRTRTSTTGPIQPAIRASTPTTPQKIRTSCCARQAAGGATISLGIGKAADRRHAFRRGAQAATPGSVNRRRPLRTDELSIKVKARCE